MVLDHLGEADLQFAGQRVVDVSGQCLDVYMGLLEQSAVGSASPPSPVTLRCRLGSVASARTGALQGQYELRGERVEVGAGKVRLVLAKIERV